MQDNEVSLKIENNILTGKIENLVKPFLVIEKNKTNNERSEKENQNDEKLSKFISEYDIVGVIRRKINFFTRPSFY